MTEVKQNFEPRICTKIEEIRHNLDLNRSKFKNTNPIPLFTYTNDHNGTPNCKCVLSEVSSHGILTFARYAPARKYKFQICALRTRTKIKVPNMREMRARMRARMRRMRRMRRKTIYLGEIIFWSTVISKAWCSFAARN